MKPEESKHEDASEGRVAYSSRGCARTRELRDFARACALLFGGAEALPFFEHLPRCGECRSAWGQVAEVLASRPALSGILRQHWGRELSHPDCPSVLQVAMRAAQRAAPGSAAAHPLRIGGDPDAVLRQAWLESAFGRELLAGGPELPDTDSAAPASGDQLADCADRLLDALDTAFLVAKDGRDPVFPEQAGLTVRHLWQRFAADRAELRRDVVSSFALGPTGWPTAMGAFPILVDLIGHPFAAFHNHPQLPKTNRSLAEIAAHAHDLDGVGARCPQEQLPRTGLAIALYCFLQAMDSVDELTEYIASAGFASFLADAVHWFDGSPLLLGPPCEETLADPELLLTPSQEQGASIRHLLGRALWQLGRTVVFSRDPGVWVSPRPLVPVRYSYTAARRASSVVSRHYPELVREPILSSIESELGTGFSVKEGRLRIEVTGAERQALGLTLLRHSAVLMRHESEPRAMALRLAAQVADELGDVELGAGLRGKLQAGAGRDGIHRSGFEARLHLSLASRGREASRVDYDALQAHYQAALDAAVRSEGGDPLAFPIHLAFEARFGIWAAMVEAGRPAEAASAWTEMIDFGYEYSATRLAASPVFPRVLLAFLAADEQGEEVFATARDILCRAERSATRPEHRDLVSTALAFVSYFESRVEKKEVRVAPSTGCEDRAVLVDAALERAILAEEDPASLLTLLASDSFGVLPFGSPGTVCNRAGKKERARPKPEILDAVCWPMADHDLDAYCQPDARVVAGMVVLAKAVDIVPWADAQRRRTEILEHVRRVLQRGSDTSLSSGSARAGRPS